MRIKFLVLGGGGRRGLFGRGSGGGSADFIFMGVGIFPKESEVLKRVCRTEGLVRGDPLYH